LEAHANLANAYVMLSGLYADSKQDDCSEEIFWFPNSKYLPEMKRKFREAAERAMEEFKILNDYAPQDPWVHAQLAYSYHDLQMVQEEIKEYETILKLCPDDKETMYKLGVLYFQQGQNAKGLRMYEELKKLHYKKAETLIKYYGSYG
jgi:tetratricopeptide (TPR) repeat protein